MTVVGNMSGKMTLCTVVELRNVALPVGFHDLVDFVDLAVEAAGGDEPGQFPADGGSGSLG